MTEHYVFEYRGATFAMDIEADSGPTTTAAPNLRVIEGSWPTWRLEITREEGQPPAGRHYRCVSESDPTMPHPHGNLTSTESASSIDMIMITEAGDFRTVPVGEAALWPWRDQAYRDAFNSRLNA